VSQETHALGAFFFFSGTEPASLSTCGPFGKQAFRPACPHSSRGLSERPFFIWRISPEKLAPGVRRGDFPRGGKDSLTVGCPFVSPPKKNVCDDSSEYNDDNPRSLAEKD